MAYKDERYELDAETVVLGLGYVTGLLIIIGWVATSFI